MKKIITKEVVAFWIICLVGGFASGFLSTHGYEKASKPYVPKLEMLSSYKMSCGDEECLRIALQEKTGWGFWEWRVIRGNPFTHPDLELVQFSGIKDIGGRAIYVGDILELPQWRPSLYVIDFDRGGFYIAQKNREEVGDIKYAELGEVIGNIYENPEILLRMP